MSYWHALPLVVAHNNRPTGSLNFICETPRNTRTKMIVGTKEKGSPIMHDQRMGNLREYPRNLWCELNHVCLYDEPNMQHPNAQCPTANSQQPTLATLVVHRFNYGRFPRTWSDPDFVNPDLPGLKGNNELLSVIEIGMRQMPSGTVRPVKVLGVIPLIIVDEKGAGTFGSRSRSRHAFCTSHFAPRLTSTSPQPHIITSPPHLLFPSRQVPSSGRS